jgi:membrane protein
MKEQPADRLGPPSDPEALLAPIVAFLLLIVAFGAAAVDRVKRRGAPAGEVAAAPESATETKTKPGRRARLERGPVLGTVLKVQTRYNELRGGNLAAAVAFQSFVSLFPLLLVIAAGIGYVAASSHVDVAGKIAANLGLTGQGARVISDAVHQAAKNRRATAPIGLIGLAWSGMGLVAAFQYLVDQVWQVEDRGVRDKARGAVWILGALVLFVGAAAATTVLNWLPGYVAPLGIAVGLGVNFVLWMWTFKVLPNRQLPWRAVVPGAVVGAIGMEALKVFGAIYVPRTVASSSALYGTLGVVLAVLAWLYLFSRLVVYSAVFNVVLWERRHGTVRTTIEVPAGRGIDRSDDVTRGGRVERQDAAA